MYICKVLIIKMNNDLNTKILKIKERLNDY
jgi:hypothetical protein